jgi:hypothetical protein
MCRKNISNGAVRWVTSPSRYNSADIKFVLIFTCNGGQESVASMVTRYEPDRLTIESQWAKICWALANWPWGPASLWYNGYRIFPWGTATGAYCWPPTPSNAKVVIGLELYLCLPSVPARPRHGVTFTFVHMQHLPSRQLWNSCINLVRTFLI